MDIAIIYGSRHGSTAEVAEAVAAVVEKAGHMALIESVETPHAASQVEKADAVVLGSAVYLEHWMPEMIRFISENAEALDGTPLAVFSVGINGEQPVTEIDLEPVAEAMFKGCLSEDAGWGSGGGGDFRDWSAIRAFAREVVDRFEG